MHFEASTHIEGKICILEECICILKLIHVHVFETNCIYIEANACILTLIDAYWS